MSRHAAPVARRGPHIGLPVVVLALLTGVAVGWLIVTGLLARSDLTQARRALNDARAAAVDGRLGDAGVAVTKAQRATRRAHGLTSGPVWWAVAHLPLVGRTPRAVRVGAAQTDRLTHEVLPALLSLAGSASPQQLRTSGDTVDLAPLRQAEPALASAQASVADVQVQLDRTGHGFGVLPSVRHGLDQLHSSVAQLASTLDGAVLAADLLPPMLGDEGKRRYLLAFQNPAESRGTGGLVGGFGILQADAGHLTITQVGTDAELASLTHVPASLGPDYVALWGQDPALWVNSNESATFSEGAQIWLAAWQAQHGERLDGVLSLDPEVLSYLLEVIGPVTLADGSTITAGNVVSATMQEAYVRFAADPPARKGYLTDVSAAVVKRLFASPAHAGALARALGRGVAERRVLIYSDHPTEERQLAAAGIAGAVPGGPGPSLLVAVNNAAGNKLDYYLDRSVTYRGTSCRPGGMRATEVDVTLRNSVDPAAQLPDYVVGVLGGQAVTPARRNDNRVTVGWWLSPGAQVQQVTVDGKVAHINLGTDGEHPVVLTTVTLPPGEDHHLVVLLREPATRLAARLAVQPLVRPQLSTVSVPVCR